MPYGQESQNLEQSTTTDSEIKLPNHYESKNNLRTLQGENRRIFKNSQLQTKFTGSYKKRV